MISHINHHISAYIRYSVYRECPTEPWAIKKRTIPDHELVYVTGGKGEVMMNGEVYKAMDKALFYFHPCMEHAIKSDPQNPLRFYAIHFSYTYLDYVNDHWEVIGSDKLPLPYHSLLPNKQMIINYFCQIHAIYQQKDMFHKVHYNGLFSVLLATIYQVLFENAYHFGKGKKMDAIMGYIQDNIQEKLTTRELASTFKVSPDYLSTLFKKTTGETLMNYINRSKINRAKEMILQQQLKMKDIAEKLHFCDPYYFSKTFKRFEGISPSAYMAKVSLFEEGTKHI
ncbi:AraC family transcriptional regulator [Vallitalea pronyensis]|uniref:AraC family transcriptional regulator n=1 Tax=Vallitalea pronyensis TaxID=1348613 RepID=A0A8J8SG67_9FIRM|nr:response regulator transcription factor [Vallitalea pronyensis]QUI21988.1 AraC family transcriptional regulator [Vallitalea pronyensis]